MAGGVMGSKEIPTRKPDAGMGTSLRLPQVPGAASLRQLSAASMRASSAVREASVAAGTAAVTAATTAGAGALSAAAAAGRTVTDSAAGVAATSAALVANASAATGDQLCQAGRQLKYRAKLTVPDVGGKAPARKAHSASAVCRSSHSRKSHEHDHDQAHHCRRGEHAKRKSHEHDHDQAHHCRRGEHAKRKSHEHDHDHAHHGAERNMVVMRLVFEDARRRHKERGSYQARLAAEEAGETAERVDTAVILREVCTDVWAAVRTCFLAQKAIRLMSEGATSTRHHHKEVCNSAHKLRAKVVAASRIYGIYHEVHEDHEHKRDTDLAWEDIMGSLATFSMSVKLGMASTGLNLCEAAQPQKAVSQKEKGRSRKSKSAACAPKTAKSHNGARKRSLSIAGRTETV
eukprot:gnl/TRDRNA2_/TRDRNA2_37221_c0_seq1.p1 gnl/TRDRNA2_/TRDRNA2_37221_c0~~gnl/TRDRNA2_/TRDRNA2_37221_c0_seq1.p1  ORF type:complete len:423 (+),score=86.38 gnl/TRDRNA2_/TRDRNA2_37221_c0_seq1:62-1270(+)